MKKHTFYQTNIFWQLFCFMFLSAFIICFIVCVRLIVEIINNGLGENGFDKIISIFLFTLYFTATWWILKFFIIFYNNKGKLISSRLLFALVEKPFLSIKTKKGETVNFFVMYISKKDVIKIINEIRCRMKNVGNRTDIIKDEEAYLKLSRKSQINV